MKDNHKNRKQDDGIRNPESGRGKQSMASQVVIQRNPCQDNKKQNTGNKIKSKTNPTKIGTWNARTLLKPGRFEELKQQMKLNQLDILGVCETRWGDNGDFWSDDFRMIHSGDKQGKNGVGILLNKEWGLQVENTYHVNDRILLIQLKTSTVNMIVIQVYFPTSYNEDEN